MSKYNSMLDNIISVTQDSLKVIEEARDKIIIQGCMNVNVDPDALSKLTMEVHRLEEENSNLKKAIVDIATDHYEGDPEVIVELLTDYIKTLRRKPVVFNNKAFCPFCESQFKDEVFEKLESDCEVCGQCVGPFQRY